MHEDPKPSGLHLMEQITSEGVSGDYYNELMNPLMHYRDFQEGVSGAIVSIVEKPLRKYTERFPPNEYDAVITSFNRGSVLRLDAIADELNKQACAGTLNDATYRALHSEACKLLFGQGREENFGKN